MKSEPMNLKEVATEDLVAMLRRISVATGSLTCLGCGHEHNCSTRGCALIREAAAKWMVEHSPALLKRSRIVDSTKTIYDTVSGSKLKVLSSEAYSKHGYKLSCVIFDELHAQPSRDLWDVMTFGAGDARAPTLTPPNEWVSVEERLPTDEHPVLVFVGYADTMTGFITTSSYFCFDENPHWQWDGLVGDEQRTLFWMPLPAPPDRRPPEGEADGK